MTLEAETTAIVSKFDYSDDDVNKGVKEFLRQMGKVLCAGAILKRHVIC
jgi:hexokinase